MLARSSLILCLSLLACSFILGCGSSGPPLGAVTGAVTLNGQPLENAQVTFKPETGRPSLGTTDQQGKYSLRFTQDEAGAMVGSHTVTISTAIDLPDDTRAPERVPAKYNTQSDLVREVKPGNNVFDFELTD
jgi:hypothetical protein